MSRIFIVVALVVVIAALSLPFVLSSRNTNQDDYKNELAAWHVRWSAVGNAAERRSLLAELDEIRSPVGSIDLLDRHRIYVQAHVIFAQADELAVLALQNLKTKISGTEIGQILTCNNLDSLLEQLPDNSSEIAEGILTVDACSLFASANSHLVIVRNQALSEWLRDEIREHRA